MGKNTKASLVSLFPFPNVFLRFLTGFGVKGLQDLFTCNLFEINHLSGNIVVRYYERMMQLRKKCNVGGE